MNDIPDALIDQVLADPRGREQLTELLKANNITDPIESLPRETLKQAVGTLLQAAQQAQQAADGAAATVPDELLDQVLGDPAAITNIDAMLKNSGIEESIANMPREAQRNILGQILAQQSAAQQGGGFQVNLEALGLSKEVFDGIWESSQTEAGGDMKKLEEVLRTKLYDAGAPVVAVAELLSQFPKDET